MQKTAAASSTIETASMIVFKDTIAVGSVLRSDNFGQYSMSEQYRTLKQRTGLDFDPTIQVMDFLPAFLDGDRHRTIRKAMARQIASSKKLQEEAAATKIAFLFEHLFVPPNEIELVSEFALPLWQEISAAIVDRNQDALELINEIPLLFFPTLSIRERMKTNEKLRTFIENNQANIDDTLSALALTLLGAKPFVGSVVLSLYQTIAQNAGKKANEMRWPGIFPASSLLFVDRVCKHATQTSGRDFGVGARVRCFTQSETYSSEENGALLFGLGAHTCLGKGISEFVWKILVHHLNKLGGCLVPLGKEMEAHDEPFSMPRVAQIAVR